MHRSHDKETDSQRDTQSSWAIILHLPARYPCPGFPTMHVIFYVYILWLGKMHKKNTVIVNKTC
jgi:hypothetical protein